MSHHIVEVRHLRHTYPDGTTALRDVSFRITHGESVAIIGANGAGKSTLLLHLNGSLAATGGEIRIGDFPLTRGTLPDIRRTVGMVFQDPDDQLFMPTVHDDVAFGPLNLGLPVAEVELRVRDALDRVGAGHLQDKPPYHLSGGEKKRVAIAGVVAMEPEVLVLDEPTAGLDPQGVHDLINFINSLSRKYGMTVIFSTHDVSLVAEVADYVYVMNKGRFVAQGTIEEIFLQPDLLKSVRLDVPVLPKLIRSLQEKGIPVPMAYTYEDAEMAFARTYMGR